MDQQQKFETVHCLLLACGFFFFAFYYLIFWNLAESTFIFLWSVECMPFDDRQDARGRDKLQIKNVPAHSQR